MRAARLRIRIKGDGNFVKLVQPNEPSSTMVRHAREIAENMDGDLDGHVVIGWDKDGGFLIGYRFGKIPPRYGVALVKEILSSEISALQALAGFDDQ